MAQLEVKTEWTLTVTTPELRLILKALGGRLKTDDLVEAERLGDQLSHQRVTTTTHTIREAEKLLQNLKS